MREIVELVGSAPLKDIVAQTADVVEMLCIQTAVELTRNNRVAAAEMLGLSRQSLYVKLRKYGIMGRESD
jgi:DNA-binding NtrC family response regulator